MKTEKLVEQRIEKHLDLVEHNKKYNTEVETTVLPATIDGEEKDTDFRYARENMYHIIERGRDAMEELLEIAKAEESPRAFEVFGQLLKNMTDTQEKLMELHFFFHKKLLYLEFHFQLYKFYLLILFEKQV